jgi:hypothetical protein
VEEGIVLEDRSTLKALVATQEHHYSAAKIEEIKYG